MMGAAVQFLSFDTIDFWARKVLDEFQPDALLRPVPVDTIGLLDFWLPRHGVRFEVGDPERMGECEGLTDFAQDGALIVLRADQYDALLGGGEPALRPRATIAHELGHVLLHADYARQWAAYTAMLSDMATCDVVASGEGDVEWQAWAFAGCLMMPVEMVCGLEDLQPRAVGRVFNVSPQFARRHLLRLRSEGLF